jgi:outer membrane protein TolC
MRLIVSLPLILFLAACTIGPDYTPPGMGDAPDQFVNQSVLANLNKNLSRDAGIPTNWWAGFQDDQLNTLIDTGLANNFDIKASVARVEQASATLDRADAGNAPPNQRSAKWPTN